MAIRILKPGVRTLVQGSPRKGFREWSIPVSGPLDERAAQWANLVLGNKAGAALLECALKGPSFQVLADCRILVAGAVCSINVGSKTYHTGQSFPLEKDDVVSFSPFSSGVLLYIAFEGGLQMPEHFGSNSTLQTANIGGHKGRALQTGDILPINSVEGKQGGLRADLKYDVSYIGSSKPIRIFSGPDWHLLSSTSIWHLLHSEYTISPNSNRIGIRLDGPILGLAEPIDRSSKVMDVGTIQLPPNGQPIIILHDGPTTGGYSRIAQVAKVDIPSLVQRRPGSIIEFELINAEKARTIWKS